MASLALAAETGATFLEKPYLQLGEVSVRSESQKLALLWHAPDENADWAVEVRMEAKSDWRRMAPPVYRAIEIPGIERHRVWKATLSDLSPGVTFDYRVLREGNLVFKASAIAPKTRGQDMRFVVFGDCAENTPGQRAVAYQTFLRKPDFVFITGDIVYSSGRIDEYRKNYFPIYNAEEPSPETGGPLLRAIPFIAAPGNHDILNADFGKSPDTMAYFYYWSQPLNGPIRTRGGTGCNRLTGPEGNQRAFLDAAGENYPCMANFSFDYGDTHWTVLDANPYMDWTDPSLRAWVANDLAGASQAKWRIVAFHQPGFQSARSHFGEQRMRLLADVFEQGRADLVFSGHVHNYQRSYPLQFRVDPGARDQAMKAKRANGPIGGEWTLDKTFDGDQNAHPKGVIYIVTGAGGAPLYNPEQETKRDSWQAFTCKFIANTHSFTLVDVAGNSLTLRQFSETGDELDHFRLLR